MGDLLGFILTLTVGLALSIYLTSKGVNLAIVLILAFFIGYAGRKISDRLSKR